MVGQYSVSGGPLKGPGGPNGPPVCYLKYALVKGKVRVRVGYPELR